jgi:excisionase family DNA binding protein
VKTATKRATKATQAKSESKLKLGRPLTARAVAELCGVELKTVHNWAVDGKLAHFRTPGRHLRFKPEVVAAFLRECGYETNGKVRLRVVCVAASPTARLRKVLAGVDCTWVADVWSALLEIGRAAPDIWLVDASQRAPEGLSHAVKALEGRLPAVKTIVFTERTAARQEPGLRCVGLAALARLLTESE